MHVAQKIIQRILAAAAGLLVLALLVLGLAAYVTAAGHDLRLLKAAASRLGMLLDGQRTEAITLDAAVFPDEHRLEAHATLKLRSLREPRRRFYFLLNDGLTIRQARVAGSAAMPSVYKLWLITLVDLGRPLAPDDTVDLELDYDGRPSAGGVGIGGGLFDARDVLLGVDEFWYPNDVQSFFTADVTVTLPARMTLVHNGHELERGQRGDRQRIHWQSERPLSGMALVAGSYRRASATLDTVPLQLYVADDMTLDGDVILHDMADANGSLARRFGPSGFPRLTLFANRRLRRGFNDGAGLMGLSIRYFRHGEYGFNTVAHEIAHNWWGATVAEKWLAPGTGGEWIVEGLAEFSSLLATEERWGAEARARRMTEECFDPARQAAVADMSVLDNALAEATARDTIYRKGAYVAMMLRATIGDEAMNQALHQFLERFRYSQVTDRDLEAVVSETSGRDVTAFFADWVRSNKLADLTLEPVGAEQVSVQNRGDAVVPGPIDLSVVTASGEALERHTVQVGETVALPSGAHAAIVDPQGSWADMLRDNNRAPRRSQPRYVAVSSRGDILITNGEPQPWAPATLTQRTPDGTLAHTWEFDRGLTEPPAWSADGARILVSLSEATGPWPAVVALNAVDGSRATIGYGASPAFGSNGWIIAARGDQLVRFDAGSRASVQLVRHRGRSVESPLPSPSGRRVAYVVAHGNAVDLRVCDDNGGARRSLLTWDRDRFVARWAADESRLYAVIGGDWDWQVWEIPLDGSAVRVLVREAAGVRDLALSPDGTRLAFTAAPSLTRPAVSHRLYVLDLKTGRAQAFDDTRGDIWHFAWEKADTVLDVVRGGDAAFMMPEARELRRVHLGDGSSEKIEG